MKRILSILLLVLLAFTSTDAQVLKMMKPKYAKLPIVFRNSTPPATRSHLFFEWTVEQATSFNTQFPPTSTPAFQPESFEHLYAYNGTRSTTVARSGSWSGRFELRKPDMMDDRWRSEIVFYQLANSLDTGWYGFSVYLPSDLDQDSNNENFFQLHDFSDACDGVKIPAISLNWVNNNYDLNIAWNATACSSGWSDIHVDLGSLLPDKGTWVDWVFYIKFDYRDNINGGTGVLTVWKNGVQVYTRNGPNCFNDVEGPYGKWGMHRAGWSTGLDSPRIIYIDDIRTGSGQATYNDVKPGN